MKNLRKLKFSKYQIRYAQKIKGQLGESLVLNINSEANSGITNFFVLTGNRDQVIVVVLRIEQL